MNGNNGNANGQNKMMLIAAGAVVVVLLLIGFFSMRKSPTQKISPSITPSQSATQPGSLLDLIGMGKTVQCDFNYSTEAQNTTKGTVYVSGGKVRGDFDTTVEGKTSSMHMIRDPEYTYMWGSAMEQGIKMGNDETNPEVQTNKYFDSGKKVDYKCTPWGVNQSLFTVPADVKFQDISAMMQNSMKKAGVTGTPVNDVKSSQCAACAQLEGDARATCEKQLGC